MDSRKKDKPAGKKACRRKSAAFLALLLLLNSFFGALLFAWTKPEAAHAAAAPATTATKKTLYVGYGNYQIKFKNLSEKAKVTYKSSNTKAAKVTSRGVVKPVAKGTATITVTMKQSGKTYTSKIKVTVKNPYIAIPNKQTVLVQSSDYKLTGKAYGLKDPSFRYVSSNVLVAKVDAASGMVHARAAGTAKITMTEKNSGKSVSYTLRVVERTEENADQVYISTKEFRGDYSYAMPKNVSQLTKEEAAQAEYLAGIQKRVTAGESITLQEMTDYFLNRPKEPQEAK